MKYFFLFIIIAYILLSPFYIFESGLPQPADFVIAFGCIFLIFSKDFPLYLKQDVVKKFIYFISLTIFINIFFFLFFKSLSIVSFSLTIFIFYFSNHKVLIPLQCLVIFFIIVSIFFSFYFF